MNKYLFKTFVPKEYILLKSLWTFIMFHIGTVLNNINWRRVKRKTIRLKNKRKLEHFVVPRTKTTLGVISGIYPYNKVFLKNGKKRLKYKDLIQLSYFNTLNIKLKRL